jgi:RNA polymerase primary sigma factor
MDRADGNAQSSRHRAAQRPASNLRETTTRMLASLNPREERILRMRFGIGMNTDHTLEEVGRQFSLTRERIRQRGQDAEEAEAPEPIKRTQELPQ